MLPPATPRSKGEAAMCRVFASFTASFKTRKRILINTGKTLERLIVTFTANGLTRAILYYTVNYFYSKVRSFTLVMSITTVLDCINTKI